MEYGRLKQVYDWLEDDESRKVFDTRLDYVFNGNRWKFMDIRPRGGYFQPEFDTFMQTRRDKKIVLYGAGRDGAATARILKGCGYAIRAFCDTDRRRAGQKLEGYPILTPEELFALEEPCVIFIASSNYGQKIYRYLCKFIYHRDEIAASTKHEIYLPGGMPFLDSYLPGQYFDFFEPQAREVFVDCGAYNGQTSVQFAQWCKGDYEAIHLFEANPHNVDWCRKTLAAAGVERYELVTKGTWDKDDTLSFAANELGASKVADWGEERVPVTSIDKALAGRRVTYIKMDIEGAEPQALKGAMETIRAQRPRLAISAYHKQDDFVELPRLVKGIEPSYHIAFRHYTSFNCETVLYAWA